ncbi:MAG TPA: RNA polymerase sigma factor [Acidimicrobiia bacterium]
MAVVESAGGAPPTWDERVLDELRRLYNPLRRFAAIAGRLDVEPDDLVQEAYTRFLAGDRSDVADVGAYLRRTIVNLASNERRRSRRAGAAAQRLGPDMAAVDTYPSALADLLGLDPRDRALLYLVDVDGYQAREAAEIVGINAAAARMALSRGRRALRAAMETESTDV